MKGERRDKRKFYFCLGYAEPHPIFVPTNIVKGECKVNRKFYFKLDYVEPQPIFYKYSEWWARRQTEIVFPIWFYPKTPIFYKGTKLFEKYEFFVVHFII